MAKHTRLRCVALFAAATLPMQVYAAPVVLTNSNDCSSEAGFYLISPASTDNTSAMAGQSAETDLSLSDARDTLDCTVSGSLGPCERRSRTIAGSAHLFMSDDQTTTWPGPISTPLGDSAEAEQWRGGFKATLRSGQRRSRNPTAFDVADSMRCCGIEHGTDLSDALFAYAA